MLLCWRVLVAYHAKHHVNVPGVTLGGEYRPTDGSNLETEGSAKLFGHFGFNSYLPDIRDGNHGDYEQESSKVRHLLRQDFVLTESKHFLFFLVLSMMNCELWTVII